MRTEPAVTPPRMLPEVSLISSWHAGSPTVNTAESLPGLAHALKAGVSLFDLNFLGHEEISWYAKAAGIQLTPETREPHAFAASLNAKHLGRISEALCRYVVRHYEGPFVGRRPRFAALATFFPDASLPPCEDTKGRLRSVAVRALARTIVLAHTLGCPYVEIVGGPAFPGPRHKKALKPKEYLGMRLDALAASIVEAYDQASELLPGRAAPRPLPRLCAELEPGAFLLNSLERFQALRKRLKAVRGAMPVAYKSLLLNVDIAHAFIIGYNPETLHKKHLAKLVGHIHLSDHGAHKHRGGMHAQDLPPNTYHSFMDYKPWLEFACERMQDPDNFSGAIAIELEAINDTAAVLASLDTTRRWLERIGRPVPGATKNLSGLFLDGAIMVVDIGRSTSIIFGGGDPRGACRKMEAIVQAQCQAVLEGGGSVMSFTGDGLVAFFESKHFMSPNDAAHAAHNAALGAVERFKSTLQDQKDKLSLRVALHWGEAYLPTEGPLRNQIIGEDVICATRLCDWISHVIEESIPPDCVGVLLWGTDAFVQQLEDRSAWNRRGRKPFKGLDKSYLLHHCNTPPA